MFTKVKCECFTYSYVLMCVNGKLSHPFVSPTLNTLFLVITHLPLEGYKSTNAQKELLQNVKGVIWKMSYTAWLEKGDIF